MTLRYSLIALAVASILPAGQALAGGPLDGQTTGRPVFAPLDAAQLSKIQAVGQGILAAKSNPQVPAEERALQAQLHDLASAVDSALVLHQPTLNPTIDKARGESAAMTESSVGQTRAEVASLLAPKLDALRQRRTQIESAAPSDSGGVHVQHLAARLQGVEQALADALSAANDAERLSRLADLRQRLRGRTLDEWRQDRKDEARLTGEAAFEADTPTMTTMTQHRAGLDDLRPTKR